MKKLIYISILLATISCIAQPNPRKLPYSIDVQGTVEAEQFIGDGSLLTGVAGSGDMKASDYDPLGIIQQMVGTNATQTLTNKTLTSPVINTHISGTVTSGGNITSTNYLIGATAIQTLINKTLTSPVINNPTGIDADDVSDTSTTKKFVNSSILSDITSNTASRHNPVSVLDSAELDFTLTGQQITAAIITGSIDVLKLDSGVQTSLSKADSALQSEVDGSVTNEIQTIDVSQLVGTELQISLSNDGEATKTIDLSPLVGSSTVDVVSNVATQTILGRNTAGSGNSEELTPTQVRAIIDFDTEVENNTEVLANTTARHAAVSVLDGVKIDLGLSGQQITADIIAGTLELTDLSSALQTTIAKIDVNESDIAALETNKLDTSLLIDDDTFASATSSNIPSAESVKNYVDASNGSIDTNPRAVIATEGEYTEVYNESAPNFKIPITGDTDISVTSLESGDYGMVIAENATSTPYKVRLTTATDTLSNILISEKAFFSHFTDSTGTTWFRSYEDGKINHLITKAATTGFTDIDWAESAIQTFQFGTANDTLSFIPPKYPTNDLKLIVKQDAVGSRTLAYTNDMEVVGSLPTLTTTANAVDIITYIYDGEKYYLYDIKKDFETVAGVDPYVPPLPEPILRMNGGGALVTATDGFVDWEDGTTGTGVGFTSTGGANYNSSSIAWAKHSSVLDLPDADIQTIYDNAKYTNSSITYNVPVANGTYTVRFLLGTHSVGGEVSPLSISLEGVTVLSGFQPNVAWGYQTMGSLEFEVTVSDGSLTMVVSKDSGTPQINIFGWSIKQ